MLPTGPPKLGLRRSNMKNRVFATFSSMTLLTAAAAFAQSDTALRADIPFEFRVGGKILPAGSYEVRTQFAPNILVLQCFKCNASALTLTTSAYARETPKTGGLGVQPVQRGCTSFRASGRPGRPGGGQCPNRRRNVNGPRQPLAHARKGRTCLAVTGASARTRPARVRVVRACGFRQTPQLEPVPQLFPKTS